jgi:hypothetical protein
MRPDLEKRVVTLIEAPDACFAINGETANLAGLLRNAKELRAVRQVLTKS